jgi:carbonic anhydrase
VNAASVMSDSQPRTSSRKLPLPSGSVQGLRQGILVVDDVVHEPLPGDEDDACGIHDQTIADERARLERLCEPNVIEQVVTVSETTVVRDAWDRGQALSVHGWIYILQDGIIRDLGMGSSSPAEAAERYAAATGSSA